MIADPPVSTGASHVRMSSSACWELIEGFIGTPGGAVLTVTACVGSEAALFPVGLVATTENVYVSPTVKSYIEQFVVVELHVKASGSDIAV